MNDISFREWSALGSAIFLVIVAGIYFPDAFLIAGSAGLRLMGENGEWQLMDEGAALVRHGIAVVVLLVILEIAYHTVLGIRFRDEIEETRDERDRQVVLRSSRVAYLVLDVGLLVFIGNLFYFQMNTLLVAQWILLLLVAAEVAKLLATFAYYRLNG